jgi:hypothetical protein
LHKFIVFEIKAFVESQFNLVRRVRLPNDVPRAGLVIGILAADDRGMLIEVCVVRMSHDPNLVFVAIQAIWCQDSHDEDNLRKA